MSKRQPQYNMPFQKAGRHHNVACLLIKMDDMRIIGVDTDCCQEGVHQVYRNKSVRVTSKAMIWQKHAIIWFEAEGEGGDVV